MSTTSIEWAMMVWNAVVGCTRISPGCEHCYAEVMAWRHVLMCRALGRPCKYEGTVHLVGGKPRWTGVLKFDKDALMIPIRRKKPTTFFVDSMSDLFHEKAKLHWIDQLVSVMAQTPQHTYQILTKRADALLAYSLEMARLSPVNRALRIVRSMYLDHPAEYLMGGNVTTSGMPWPLPNVHLGVSVENQKTFEERTELLGRTPAAVRFLSMEPMLEEIDPGNAFDDPPEGSRYGRIDLVIIGGESGHHARPFNIAWPRPVIAAARAGGARVYVKQMGSRPVKVTRRSFDTWLTWVHKAPTRVDKGDVCIDAMGRVLKNGADFAKARDENAFPVGIYAPVKLKDRKGGDMAEWEDDLRIRELMPV